MKRALWFDVSMLVLILVVATIGATLDRGTDHPATASAQSASAQAGTSTVR